MQVRPGVLDFFQLAQAITAERLLSDFARLRRVRAELSVEFQPREAQRARDRERAIGEPEIQVEDLVAWIIPKDALSSCFSTQGIT